MDVEEWKLRLQNTTMVHFKHGFQNFEELDINIRMPLHT